MTFFSHVFYFILFLFPDAACITMIAGCNHLAEHRGAVRVILSTCYLTVITVNKAPVWPVPNFTCVIIHLDCPDLPLQPVAPNFDSNKVFMIEKQESHLCIKKKPLLCFPHLLFEVFQRSLHGISAIFIFKNSSSFFSPEEQLPKVLFFLARPHLLWTETYYLEFIM